MKDVRCTYDFADNDDVDYDDSDNNDCYADDNDCQCQNVITVFRLPFSIWCWSYWMAEIPLNRNETNQTESQRNIYIELIFSIPFYFFTHTHVCSKAIFYSCMFAKVNLYSQALFKCGTLISYFFYGKFMKSSLLLLLLERIFSSIIITVDFSFQEIFVLLSCHKVCMACMA